MQTSTNFTLLKNSQGNENATEAIQTDKRARIARLIFENRRGSAKGRHIAKYLKKIKIIFNENCEVCMSALFKEGNML
jgi:hypothetical protein